MDNHAYGEIFQRESSRSTRPSRSSARSRRSYNENLIAPSIGERDDGDANASSFPCVTFMRDAGIYEDFLFLVGRVGLTTYMNDESNQYAVLTKTFVESFTFHNHAYNPYVAFKIYDMHFTISLSRFCEILGIPMFGQNNFL